MIAAVLVLARGLRCQYTGLSYPVDQPERGT